jgi:hypothetical protein
MTGLGSDISEDGYEPSWMSKRFCPLLRVSSGSGDQLLSAVAIYTGFRLSACKGIATETTQETRPVYRYCRTSRDRRAGLLRIE